MTEVVYNGSYDSLVGLHMSEAYESTLELSFDVRGGLLMRQIHHWAATLFLAAMLVHMLRVFFTGAYRKPREINWLVGLGLLQLGIVEGFAGYSLPDDLLSGTGLRIAEGLMRSIPIVGTYISFFVFGGEFPGDDFIPRLYIAHVLLIPGILLALITLHMLLLVYHKHTQWPGPGRTNNNVVGYPLLPVYMAKAGGFFFIVFGVTALMSALFQINPVLGLRPLQPSGSDGGLATRLVHGLARRGATHHARLGVHHPRVDVLDERLHPRRGADGSVVRRPRRLSVRGAVGHRRQADPPPAGASAQRPDPHRVRGRGDHGLRAAVDLGRQRHHRHPVPSGLLLDHPDIAGPHLRRTRHRVHPDPADLHRPAAQGRRGGPARLRDRRDHALARRHLHRAARAGQPGIGVDAHGARPHRGRRAARGHG